MTVFTSSYFQLPDQFKAISVEFAPVTYCCWYWLLLMEPQRVSVLPLTLGYLLKQLGSYSRVVLGLERLGLLVHSVFFTS